MMAEVGSLNYLETKILRLEIVHKMENQNLNQNLNLNLNQNLNQNLKKA